MEQNLGAIVDECKRQEESCLYTSTALFEWLKELRIWKGFFVVTPIVLGAVAGAQILKQSAEFQWVTAGCAVLAGIFPAVYKSLDLDVSLKTVSDKAHAFKTLQDRFRQAWRITALSHPSELEKSFADLMERMDTARAGSITPPERCFRRAQEKIESGHYDFTADNSSESTT